MSWASIVSGKARQNSPSSSPTPLTNSSVPTNHIQHTDNLESPLSNHKSPQLCSTSSMNKNSSKSSNSTKSDISKTTDNNNNCLHNKNTKRKGNSHEHNTNGTHRTNDKQISNDSRSPHLNSNHSYNGHKQNQQTQQKSKSHQRRHHHQQQQSQTLSPQSKQYDPPTPKTPIENGDQSPKLSQSQSHTPGQQQQASLNRSFWNDPQTLASYHLWTHHITEFMAQPAYFFHFFVVDLHFRQSVFDAGLTFHPDTDPNNPVLINLNSSRFGMADRISALSPPAGLESRSTPRSSIQTPLKTGHPFSPLSEVSQPLQQLPTPVSLGPANSILENGHTNSGSANSDESIGYPENVPFPMNVVDHQEMAPFYLTTRYVDENLARRFDGLRMEASDSESERLSEADMAMGNGIRYGIAPFDLISPRYSSRKGDGRQQINSRVRDTRHPSKPIIEQQSDVAKIRLIEQIAELFPQISSDDNFSRLQSNLLERMRAIIANEWEGAGIDVYGSAGNGLGLRSADVDMSVYMPSTLANDDGPERNKSESSQVILARLAGLLQAKGMVVQSKFLSARVPVIKLFDPKTTLHVDVCVNNILAVKNTELIRAYVDLDARFRYVCILVKRWTKNRQLNDAYAGTLSSYAYTLLVIHYLQTLDPPVLPCLQQMVGGKRVKDPSELPKEMTDNGNKKLYNTYFDRTVTPETFTSENLTPVHELLLGFFKYYGYSFQYRTHLVAIRLGVLVNRSERKWDEVSVFEEWDKKTADYKTQLEYAKAAQEANQKAEAEERRRANEAQNGATDKSPVPRTRREHVRLPPKPRLASKHLFCIEDPFDIDHDLSRGMEKAAVTVIRQEMVRAYETMAETGDYDMVCEEYDADAE